jgi:hypothetical protein
MTGTYLKKWKSQLLIEQHLDLPKAEWESIRHLPRRASCPKG